MLKRLVVFICLLAGITGAALYFSKQTHAPNAQTATEFLRALTEQAPKQENLPEPLRKTEQGKSIRKNELLTRQGVIALTNTERQKEQRVTLKENTLLNKAAEAKLNDMFAQQYFEHESPQGKGPADVIEATGYAYILVGENLAEGDFDSNADLIQGWMNSPGHRANILNPQYREIGVAVKKGMYQGRQVWMAVQEFGRPLSDCPAVDSKLKEQIASNEAKIKALELELNLLSKEMENAQKQGDADAYNSRVPQYNKLANEINQLIAATKELVKTYNAQVEAFNTCIK